MTKCKWNCINSSLNTKSLSICLQKQSHITKISFKFQQHLREISLLYSSPHLMISSLFINSSIFICIYSVFPIEMKNLLSGNHSDPMEFCVYQFSVITSFHLGKSLNISFGISTEITIAATMLLLPRSLFLLFNQLEWNKNHHENKETIEYE